MALYRSSLPNNPAAVSALPDIKRTGYSRAMLINLDTGERWNFLLNPSSLSFTTTVNYAVGALIGVNRQPLAWTSTDGKILQISDLLLNTTAERKSCRAQVERLERLGVAQPGKGKPPALSFVWGEQSLSPCVIIGDIAWTETQFVNGIAVEARLSFTLRETGEPKSVVIAPTIELIPSTSNSGGIPIPAPSQNPLPTPVPQPGTPSQPATPSTPGGGIVGDEAALDKLGFGAGISLGGASAFAIAPRKVLTAAHMVKSVGETVRMQLRGDDSTVEKSFSGTVKAINQGLDAAWIEVDFDFEIYWQLGDETQLKDGDRCVAYGHPSGGTSQYQEKNTGVFRRLGSGSQGVIFGMPDPNNRLLYPGNSGGAICGGQAGSSQYGKIISLTSGGDGRPNKPASTGQAVQLQGSTWQTDKVYGPRVSQVKAAFGL